MTWPPTPTPAKLASVRVRLLVAPPLASPIAAKPRNIGHAVGSGLAEIERREAAARQRAVHGQTLHRQCAAEPEPGGKGRAGGDRDIFQRVGRAHSGPDRARSGQRAARYGGAVKQQGAGYRQPTAECQNAAGADDDFPGIGGGAGQVERRGIASRTARQYDRAVIGEPICGRHCRCGKPAIADGQQTAAAVGQQAADRQNCCRRRRSCRCRACCCW